MTASGTAAIGHFCRGIGAGLVVWTQQCRAKWHCPSRADFFLLTFAVIIPELVLPSQMVAYVQVSRQL